MSSYANLQGNGVAARVLSVKRRKSLQIITRFYQPGSTVSMGMVWFYIFEYKKKRGKKLYNLLFFFLFNLENPKTLGKSPFTINPAISFFMHHRPHLVWCHLSNKIIIQIVQSLSSRVRVKLLLC